MEPHRNGNAAQILWIADLRLGRNEDRCRRDRVRVGVHLAVPAGGGHVPRPMTGAADVGLAPLLEALVGADLVRRGVGLVEIPALPDAMELVVEACLLEVPLLLGDPLVQPEVRTDDELAHRCSSLRVRMHQRAMSSKDRDTPGARYSGSSGRPCARLAV